ncbi:TetR/AcrR family transcriptional regulator [Agromyces bauzanensis]
MKALTRHTEATRQAILDASAELFQQRGGDGFSVQQVADRAGVTHRTVYRYFPTRVELLGATAERLSPGFADDPFAQVATVEEWIEAVEPHFARTERSFDLVREVVAAMFASGEALTPADTVHERDAHRWDIFRREFPNLSEDDARRTFVALRHLMSSTSYVLLRLRFGLSPAEATETIRAAASHLTELAATRDGAAEQRGQP